MPAVDPEFKGIGKAPGMKVWRIEQMKVVPVPTKLYGQFYSGDSYILLKTKKTEGGDALEWDVHFWLGADTSIDEQGTAAIKTVELDDSLGGAPIQHRETQDHESPLFLSYFKKGVRYLKGGVASGFKHVEKDSTKRLLRVKGKKNVRVREVALSVDSLNKGDVFILDAVDIIYQWVGPDSNRMERMKGAIVAREIRDETRAGRAKVKVIDLQWEDDEDFFKTLGSKGKIKDSTAVSDAESEKVVKNEVKLYRFSDESGQMKVNPCFSAPLEQKHLNHNDAHILDTGDPNSGIFVWVGKGCTKNEKKFAIENAHKFLVEKNYPKWTRITTLVDGGEVPVFKQYFKDWRDPDDQKGMGNIHHFHRIAKAMPEVKIDVDSMHARNAGVAPGMMPDEGKGKVEVLRVEDKTVKPVAKDAHGIFFGGDSYVVKYEATNAAKDVLIYYWLGAGSSAEEKACAAQTAKKMDDDLGGKPITLKIAQGKEPDHFLRIFQGKLIIFQEGKVAGFKNLKSDKDARLFHVRGTTDDNTRAVQVPCKGSSLNSNDVFVADGPSHTLVWAGKACSTSEKKMGMAVAKRITSGGAMKEIKEKSEPADFWKLIGGKVPYIDTKEQGVKPFFPPRLFEISNESGALTVEEIDTFTQADLDPDDVMLLDTYDQVFIWVGAGAHEQERNEAQRVAEDYVAKDPTTRNADDVSIVTVKQGNELPYFTCHFHGWDKNFWKDQADWEKMKADLEGGK